ncbi:hypothetical protein EJ06DRAFT_527058 [Trichodelitschia bisporula]|uniref:Uncharacterized protein n=1 Tax=Trichodelitschia bisporula TaxID=703511 RepID=A0A6G1I559_9PEZI|nr:hypothetical protein EJ06DRAFT_527058 [Trichodelitschia bisporula]
MARVRSTKSAAHPARVTSNPKSAPHNPPSDNETIAVVMPPREPGPKTSEKKQDAPDAPPATRQTRGRKANTAPVPKPKPVEEDVATEDGPEQPVAKARTRVRRAQAPKKVTTTAEQKAALEKLQAQMRAAQAAREGAKESGRVTASTRQIQRARSQQGSPPAKSMPPKSTPVEEAPKSSSTVLVRGTAEEQVEEPSTPEATQLVRGTAEPEAEEPATPEPTQHTVRVPNTPDMLAAAPPAALPERTLVENTPPPPDDDDDLYGLSPSGHTTQLLIEQRRQSAVAVPQSTLRARGTPHIESSVLPLAKFKRRPRQGSVIHMVAPQDTLMDVDNSELDAQVDNYLDLFQNFNPEDESTPLNLNKRLRDAQSTKEKEKDVSPEEPMRSSSTGKRKRGSDVVVHHIEPTPSPSIPSSPPPDVHREPSVPRSDVSLPDASITPVAQHSAIPDIDSDTMAPPHSTSSLSPQSPRTTTVVSPLSAKSRKPGKPGKQKNKPQKKQPKLDTATLQSLLPLPRTRAQRKTHKDAYEISSDNLNDESMMDAPSDSPDDDSEIYSPKGARRPKKAPPKRGRKAPEKTTSKGAGGKTTYGKRGAHAEDTDKENGAGRRTSGDSDLTTDGRDLEAARQKFKEVDAWEMEFESVESGGGEMSSPWR